MKFASDLLASISSFARFFEVWKKSTAAHPTTSPSEKLIVQLTLRSQPFTKPLAFPVPLEPFWYLTRWRYRSESKDHCRCQPYMSQWPSHPPYKPVAQSALLNYHHNTHTLAQGNSKPLPKLHTIKVRERQKRSALWCHSSQVWCQKPCIGHFAEWPEYFTKKERERQKERGQLSSVVGWKGRRGIFEIISLTWMDTYLQLVQLICVSIPLAAVQTSPGSTVH
jgi:hypothetical protein